MIAKEPVRSQRRADHDLDRLFGVIHCGSDSLGDISYEDLEGRAHQVPCGSVRLDVEEAAEEVGVHCARRNPETALDLPITKRLSSSGAVEYTSTSRRDSTAR